MGNNFDNKIKYNNKWIYNILNKQTGLLKLNIISICRDTFLLLLKVCLSLLD